MTGPVSLEGGLFDDPSGAAPLESPPEHLGRLADELAAHWYFKANTTLSKTQFGHRDYGPGVEEYTISTVGTHEIQGVGGSEKFCLDYVVRYENGRAVALRESLSSNDDGHKVLVRQRDFEFSYDWIEHIDASDLTGAVVFAGDTTSPEGVHIGEPRVLRQVKVTTTQRDGDQSTDEYVECRSALYGNKSCVQPIAVRFASGMAPPQGVHNPFTTLYFGFRLERDSEIIYLQGMND